MHGFLGPPPECDSGGVGGGLGTCILMQWLGRSLNQHFNEWTPTDHLPKVEWPRSDKIWPGRLCSLYHLMLLEIKREGKNQRQSQLLVLCWTKDSFIHLSPPPPPIQFMFQLHWISHSTWSRMTVFIFLLLCILFFQPRILVPSFLLPAEVTTSLKHHFLVKPS